MLNYQVLKSGVLNPYTEHPINFLTPTKQEKEETYQQWHKEAKKV